MLIDHIFPGMVAQKSTVRERLIVETMASGLTNEYAVHLTAAIPEHLINAGAFLDRLTGLWRYEFGIPYSIANSHCWGTHMWVPVANLFAALRCAYARLSEENRTRYLVRLANPEKHHAILVEMIPAQKADSAIPMEFEVAGLGAGNRTVDWVMRPNDGRIVLLDVKRRTTDFIKQAEGMSVDASAQTPIHDPSLLFRSVEQKFTRVNSQVRLQGVWICTDIKQDEERLTLAFSDLCAARVHFAILGDWRADAYVLTRKPEDQQYLRSLFRITTSDRFTFRVNNEG